MHQPVTREELLDIAQYEKARPEFRERVLAQKVLRRISVGAHFTFLFENRLTVLYQIQDEQYNVVAPTKWASAKFIHPIPR